MTINTAITETAVVSKTEVEGKSTYIVRSPLASFVAPGKDRQAALTNFIQMMGAYYVAQQRQGEIQRKPGRPSKHYDTHVHVQVSDQTKARFEQFGKEYHLSQSETIIFLLNCADILKDEFVKRDEIKTVEDRLFNCFAGAR